MYFTAATIALLSAVASSTPSPTSAPQYPLRLSSQCFRLVGHVISNDLTPSIQNSVVTSYRTAAGLNYAVLAANRTASTGRNFYANGTADEVRDKRADVLSDEGTPPFPAGIVINPPSNSSTPGSKSNNSEANVTINASQGSPGIGINPPSNSSTPGSKSNNSELSVSINAGQGSPGVGITRAPDNISKLYTVAGQGFYACQRTLPFGPAVQLFVKQQSTPQGCVDLVLLPQCSETDGLTHPFGAISKCYEDVAGTDWSAAPS